MASRIIMQRRGQYLAPTDSDGMEVINALGRDELVSVNLVRPRNIGHHRKFFKMIGEVFKAQNEYMDQDHMLDDIRIELGHCRRRVRPDGTISFSPRSISFARMDQGAFEIFYNRFLDYCIHTIIPGVDKADFEMHLYSIMDGQNYAEKMR